MVNEICVRGLGLSKKSSPILWEPRMAWIPVVVLITRDSEACSSPVGRRSPCRIDSKVEFEDARRCSLLISLFKACHIPNSPRLSLTRGRMSLCLIRCMYLSESLPLVPYQVRCSHAYACWKQVRRLRTEF